jgi:serine/threonine protein kinase
MATALTIDVFGDTVASSPNVYSAGRETVRLRPGELSCSSSRQVGSYELVRQVGAGGMGEVWEAVHTRLHKRVAIKFLSPELCNGRSAEMVERFLQEGVLACQVTHPNIVDVTDVGVHDGIPYLVMEFLHGLSLADRLRREVIPCEEAVELFLPVTAALFAAHEAGVVHRDIKPANIIVVHDSAGQPLPKLVDFGISRLQGAEVTRVSMVLGTPGYMAPELLTGQSRGDPLTDQYALGVTLYEVVTRKPAPDSNEVIPPTTIRPEIPEELEQVILRAMHHDPRRRFPNVRELGAALLPLASVRQRLNWEPILYPNEHSDTIRETPQPIVNLHARRRRQVWGFHALLFLAALTIGGLGVVFWHQLTGRAAAAPPARASVAALPVVNTQPLADAPPRLVAAPTSSAAAEPAVRADVTPATSMADEEQEPPPSKQPAKKKKPRKHKRKHPKSKQSRKGDAPKTDNRDPWAD